MQHHKQLHWQLEGFAELAVLAAATHWRENQPSELVSSRCASYLQGVILCERR